MPETNELWRESSGVPAAKVEPEAEKDARAAAERVSVAEGLEVWRGSRSGRGM